MGKLNSVSSSPILATPLLPTSSAAAPKDCTVLDDDPAIVRVNKNSVEPERKNLNVFGGKKLKSSPSKKEEIKEKKKDNEVQCLSIHGLRKLNPNSFFKKEQFPDSFFQIAPDVEVLEETLQWASIWMARRLEKREYVHKKGILPIEKMLIHIAFNQLSNEQLEYWMDIQRQKIIDLVVESTETVQELRIEPKATQKEAEPVRAAKQDAAEKECR